jgi:LysM repeat protein
MRFSRALLTLVALLALSGCGYVHFGRLPEAAPSGDAMGAAYSTLSTEHKILQQELTLARKEGDALRAALDSRAGGADTAALTARLNETARELATLRASYAKLQAAKGAADPAQAARLADTEEKLAASLRSYTQLQEENAKLRTEVDTTRAENSTLTTQVKTITAENAQAQAALAQLNTELLAQKDARARAEQQAEAVRSQLTAVVSARDAAPATLASARESSASSTSGLSLAAAPAAEKPAIAELRVSPERLRAAAEKKAATAKPTPPAPRIHVVVAGDTLEKIAKKYYGDPGKWNTIYFANNAQLSGGRPLKPGMELEIPEN